MSDATSSTSLSSSITEGATNNNNICLYGHILVFTFLFFVIFYQYIKSNDINDFTFLLHATFHVSRFNFHTFSFSRFHFPTFSYYTISLSYLFCISSQFTQIIFSLLTTDAFPIFSNATVLNHKI